MGPEPGRAQGCVFRGGNMPTGVVCGCSWAFVIAFEFQEAILICSKTHWGFLCFFSDFVNLNRY